MNHRRTVACLAVLFPGLCGLGLVIGASPKDTGPSANEIPSRIVLTWSGDTARTQNVTWRTEAPLERAEAQITRFDSDPRSVRNAKTVEGSAARLEMPEAETCGQYAVRFTGLEPDTAYCYRVGNGRAWSAWNVFRTAKSGVAPFRFLYLGDTQNELRSMCSRGFRAAYRAAPDARFIAMAGDIVNRGHDDHLWGELFEAFGFISAEVPLVPVPGNHDLIRADGTFSYTVTPLWKRYFVLPENGPKGLEALDQQNYYLDYQGVRVIALDVNPFEKLSKSPPEREQIRDREFAWLEETLKNNPNPWTVVLQHHPVHALKQSRDYPEMRAMLAPLYEKYSVAMVLEGHDHAYGRMQKNGVTYVVSVAGPKMYEPGSTYAGPATKTASHTQMYQVVDVNSQRMTMKAYAIDGRLVDSVEVGRRR